MNINTRNMNFVKYNNQEMDWVKFNGNLVYENYRDMVVSGNDIINITKAKANSLNYLKRFGKCEQNGTPTPDSPVDIMCNNGTLKYGLLGKNLYSSTDTIVLSKPEETGSPRAATKFINPIPEGTYRFSGKLTTTNNTKISVIFQYTGAIAVTNVTGLATDFDLSVTFNQEVTRLYVYIPQSQTDGTATLSDIQIELGSTATSYEPYQGMGIYVDGTQETINVHGKNLFDKNSAVNNGTFAWASGEPITEQNSWISDFIPIVHNTSYVSNYYLSQVFIYDENKTAILILRNNTWQKLSSAGGGLANVFTTPNEGSYLRFSLRRNPSTGTPAASPDLVQLELGSTATAYEPYFNGETATAENLLSVGTYKDEQDVISGLVTKNVGVKVLNGTESWWYDRQYSRFAISLIPNSIPQTSPRSIPAYCTHFKMLSNNELIGNITAGQGYIIRDTDTSRIYLHSDITTVPDFTQYLADQYNAGTPVIIVYPLATSTTETATAQPVNIQKGVNTIQVTQASINDLELEIKYKGK